MRRFTSAVTITGVAATALVMLAGLATALIDPNFTPVHLVKDSELILQLSPQAGAKEGTVAFKVVSALKGKAPGETVSVTLPAGARKAQGGFLAGLVAGIKDGPVLLFVGGFPLGGEEEVMVADDGAEDGPARMAYLHLGGRWVKLDDAGNGAWEMGAVEDRMDGTWAGGTDMLLRAVSYILADSRADVPVQDGTGWLDPVQFAKLEGKVSGLQAVDLDGNGRLAVFAAAETGDRIWRYDANQSQLVDETAALGIGSKSRQAVWGDINGDGRPELVSWDGKVLGAWSRGGEGVFKPAALNVDWPSAPAEVVGLAVIDVGKGAGLLVSTKELPLVLKRDGDAWKSVALTAPAGEGGAAPGPFGACLVADFDGDALADVLQPGAAGGRFFKGKGAGEFEPASPCAVSLGKGPAGSCVGDYDMDGQLDVFTGSADGCRVWQNDGGGRFADALGFSGEMRYIAKPMAFGCQTCDINNDGRQDVFILYDGRTPHIFFNRGFRSFGHAHTLDLGEHEAVPGAGAGQQAGLVEDIDGNGSQDMVLVLKSGEAWFLPNELAGEEALGTRAVLAADAPTAGPMTVTGWNGKRCLGAWNVTRGGPGAVFGCVESPAEIVLKWRLPGQGEPAEKKAEIEDSMVRTAVGGAK